MTGLHRKLGALAVLLALATPGAVAQDIQGLFEQGVDLLQRGRDDEALRAFEQVLAADPSNEQAYELFRTTEHAVWLDMLRKEGDFQLFAKRMMGLAAMGRLEKQDDPEAIKPLVAELSSDDPINRRSAIRELAGLHGEYAVPYMVGALADTANEERRVSVMQALTEMNTDVVVPLLAALESADAIQRRNVALVLGRIGDPRAAGHLGWLQATDPDGGVQAAARQSLERMGVRDGALSLLLQQGEDYHLRRDDVLADYQYSRVVWSWDGGLVSTPIERAMYPDEMAKRSFQRALAVDPSSVEARAGLARAYASQAAQARALAAAGVDVDLDAAMSAALPMALVGADALDAALSKSVQQSDPATAAVLCHVVASMAPAPTAGLRAALASGDAALASEAAIAMGTMCVSGKASADRDLVAALADVARRSVVRLAMVIDGDAARGSAMEASLGARGVTVARAASGAEGLALLRRVAGLDAVVLADRLPDLTAQQVLAEIRASARLSETPVLVISDDAETASEIYAERAQGVLGEVDAEAVTEAMSETLNADRAKADELSSQAAALLATLAGSGAPVGEVADELAGTLTGRPDGVVVSAARALGAAGRSEHAAALLAVLADDARSDEARAAAGFAAAQILARTGGTADAGTLLAIADSDAGLTVRKAALAALGSLALSDARRAELLGVATVSE